MNKPRDFVTVGLILVIITVLFALAPIPNPPGGDDWKVYSQAAKRVLGGGPLYGEKYGWGTMYGYYYNPPWLATILLPLALLPFRWGWATLSSASLVIALVVARRWRIANVRLVLILLSPSMLTVLLYGQVDALILGAVLLPAELWMLAAMTKPQVMAGLALGVPRPKWMRAAVVTVLLLTISLAWFGNWPGQLVNQPGPMDGDNNLWLNLWPFQVPIGAVLLCLGVTRKDERLLVAASPFLMPYAMMSSLLGDWAATCAFLSDWQATAVFVVWWGAMVYRILL